MDTEHIPMHYRWEHLFADQPGSPVANRHVLTGDFERHTHNFMELVLVVNGSGKHLSFSRDEPLLAGQAFVIHPGVWHAYHDCKGYCQLGHRTEQCVRIASCATNTTAPDYKGYRFPPEVIS